MTGNLDTTRAPNLPDGVVIIVKEECETCQTIAPVLQQLDAATELTVYTQDNATFPSAPAAMHDADLGGHLSVGRQVLPGPGAGRCWADHDLDPAYDCCFACGSGLLGLGLLCRASHCSSATII